jgi:hypothetical protein
MNNLLGPNRRKKATNTGPSRNYELEDRTFEARIVLPRKVESWLDPFEPSGFGRMGNWEKFGSVIKGITNRKTGALRIERSYIETSK